MHVLGKRGEMFITHMPHMCTHSESVTINPTITYYWTQSKWQVLGVEFEVDGAGGLIVELWDYMLHVWNHGTTVESRSINLATFVF
jgi:hypothetical protein